MLSKAKYLSNSLGFWRIEILHFVQDDRRRTLCLAGIGPWECVTYTWPFLTRISHRFSTATADKATLTRLFSPFDLDVTRHAVVRKASNKSRHSNLLYRLATETGDITGPTRVFPWL